MQPTFIYHHIKRFKAGAIALALVGVVSTQGWTQKQWSYSDCVEWAKIHNISLQQARLAVENSQIALEAAEAQWQPSLSFSTTQGLTNAPWANGTKTSYSSNYGLNAGWTVWNGGERENTIKRRRMGVSIDELSEASNLNTIELNILSLYINILYTYETIGIQESAAEVSKAQAERAKKLMESGRLSRVDYAQLAAQAQQDQYNVVNAIGNYNSQRMELKRLLELGLTEEISLVPVSWTADDVLAALPDIQESYALTLQCDNELEADRLTVEAAQLDEKIARASGLPSLSLSAGIGTNYFSGGTSWGDQMKRGFNENIGLTVSIPIFDRKSTKTAVAQAKIQSLNADLDRQQRINTLAQEIESLYIDVNSAQARYQAGVEQVASAQLSDELVNAQFEVGLVNTVELLSAHSTLTQARQELLQAKYTTMLGKKQIEYYRTLSVSLP
ncbi:MAG: TolC family protein [Bacteroidales bacterium]|nr:TolC family protein [Bacteroidales bacterium]